MPGPRNKSPGLTIRGRDGEPGVDPSFCSDAAASRFDFAPEAWRGSGFGPVEGQQEEPLRSSPSQLVTLSVFSGENSTVVLHSK